VPDNGGRDDRRRAQAGHEARGNIRLARIGSKYRTQDGDAHRCADHACRILSPDEAAGSRERPM
jgi:hypothetical protein